jgi:hypothetical protein
VLLALLEEGVFHEPDLAGGDITEWSLRQFERIFLEGAAFDHARLSRWFDLVEQTTGTDMSEPRAILEDRSTVQPDSLELLAAR